MSLKTQKKMEVIKMTNKIYLVSYDLKKPATDYPGLYEILKNYPGWWHHLESTWLVATEDDAQKIWEKIEPHIDKNDSVLIIKINSSDRQGWLPKEAWKWINENVGSEP